MSANHPILIIGGLGKTGARIDARLKAKGYATHPASRSTAHRFDWNEPATWDAALHGCTAAYVSYQPDLAVPGAVEAIARLAEKARRQGLERIVLLSGRGEAGAERAEEALIASGMAWTILRCGWFNQNFSEGGFRGGILAGALRLPLGAVSEPFVDVDDIADVAVAALTDPDHANRLYELTGPRALTMAEAVAEIAAATGRNIAFQRITPAEFEAEMRPYLPAETIALLLELFTQVFDGRNSLPMPGVEQALGRKPRDFANFVRQAVHDGAWIS